MKLNRIQHGIRILALFFVITGCVAPLEEAPPADAALRTAALRLQRGTAAPEAARAEERPTASAEDGVQTQICNGGHCSVLPRGERARVDRGQARVCVKVPEPEQDEDATPAIPAWPIPMPEGWVPVWDWSHAPVQPPPDSGQPYPLEQGCECGTCVYLCPLHGEPYRIWEDAPDLRLPDEPELEHQIKIQPAQTAPVPRHHREIAPGCEGVATELDRRAFLHGLLYCDDHVDCEATDCQDTCRETALPDGSAHITRDDSACAEDEYACILGTTHYDCDCLCRLEI